MQEIQDNSVYKQVLSDSFGGVMYNVANQSKYDSDHLLTLWNGLSADEQSATGGIMRGAMNFLEGSN